METLENHLHGIKKVPTGIDGLDTIMRGGLPGGRPTLICGSAGCGKTLLAMEFIVKGAMYYNEPGVFVTFEESKADLEQNFISLGWDLEKLAKNNMVFIDKVDVDRKNLIEIGEFDLEGLFARLRYAINSVKAKRIVLDTLEFLFGVFTNITILRAELYRLLQWLKEMGITAIITAESGPSFLTRNGIEEYVSDCVIRLSQEVKKKNMSRNLRVIKYRGSDHDTNQFPFVITQDGIFLYPITAINLDFDVSTERFSSGIPDLDDMMGGQGFYRGSTVFISGITGAGKTSLVCSIVKAACQRSENCLYFAMEEAESQIIRNMRSIGIDLESHVKKGLLLFKAQRPSACGINQHILEIMSQIDRFKPDIVVLDPISSLVALASLEEVRGAAAYLIDFIKRKGVTFLFTDLISGNMSSSETAANVSSLVDTWVLLSNIGKQGERNRGIEILKSRGMFHSNQLREFLLTEKGIHLTDVYTGPEGVVSGSERQSLEAREKAEQIARDYEISGLEKALEAKQQALELRIDSMRKELDAEMLSVKRTLESKKQVVETLSSDRKAMRKLRE